MKKIQNYYLNGVEEIIQSIVDGNLLDITKHHNNEQYPDQKIVSIVYVSNEGFDT